MAGAAAWVSACGPDPVPPPSSLPGPPPIDPSAPKTIVVIMADDMRFDFRSILTRLDANWIDCVNAAIEVPDAAVALGTFKGM